MFSFLIDHFLFGGNTNIWFVMETINDWLALGRIGVICFVVSTQACQCDECWILRKCGDKTEWNWPYYIILLYFNEFYSFVQFERLRFQGINIPNEKRLWWSCLWCNFVAGLACTRVFFLRPIIFKSLRHFSLHFCVNHIDIS